MCNTFRIFILFYFTLFSVSLLGVYYEGKPLPFSPYNEILRAESGSDLSLSPGLV